MNRRLVLLVALCISAAPYFAFAAPKTGGSVAKADQDLVRQAAKSGLRGQPLRELAAALKQDNGIGEAVKGAIDKGLRGRELADFVHNEITSRQGQLAANGQPAAAGTNASQGMGRGMMGQGMMGQGQGMGQGMMGRGMGMGSGQAVSGNGMGMGRGMGGCSMGMGRGMRGGR